MNNNDTVHVVTPSGLRNPSTSTRTSTPYCLRVLVSPDRWTVSSDGLRVPVTSVASQPCSVSTSDGVFRLRTSIQQGDYGLVQISESGPMVGSYTSRPPDVPRLKITLSKSQPQFRFRIRVKREKRGTTIIESSTTHEGPQHFPTTPNIFWLEEWDKLRRKFLATRSWSMTLKNGPKESGTPP